MMALLECVGSHSISSSELHMPSLSRLGESPERDNEAMSVTRVSILLLLQLLGAASHVTDTLTLPITCHENSRKN